MLHLTFALALAAQSQPSNSGPASPAATQKPAAPTAAAPAANPTPGTGARKAAPTTKPPLRKTTAAVPASAMTEEQKAIYALGLMMQRSIEQFDLSLEELEICKRAITEGAAGKPAFDVEQWAPKVQTLARDRGMRVVAKEKGVSAAYLTKAAAVAGAVMTDSGLVYTELAAGTGASPTAADTVKVNYRGSLINGTEFDSSYKRGEPAQFGVSGVIKCWTEGLQKMKVGGKARLVCPSDIAYGDRGNQNIPGGAALIFEVELLDVIAAPRPNDPVK